MIQSWFNQLLSAVIQHCHLLLKKHRSGHSRFIKSSCHTHYGMLWRSFWSSILSQVLKSLNFISTLYYNKCLFWGKLHQNHFFLFTTSYFFLVNHKPMDSKLNRSKFTEANIWILLGVQRFWTGTSMLLAMWCTRQVQKLWVFEFRFSFDISRQCYLSFE